MATALSQLNADERGKYGNTESLLGDISVTPVVVLPKNDTPYHVDRAKEMTAIQNELNLIDALHRVNKARSKRLERITKKI
jgi:hypothetical protein